MTPPAVSIPVERGGNVEDEKVLSLLRGVTGKDGSLDSSTIGNSLIRVDVLVRFLVVKEVGNEFDDKRDTSGTTDQDDFMDVRLVDLGVAKKERSREGLSQQVQGYCRRDPGRALRNGHK